MSKSREKLKTMPNTAMRIMENQILRKQCFLSTQGRSIINITSIRPQSAQQPPSNAFPKRYLSRTKHIASSHSRISNQLEKFKFVHHGIGHRAQRSETWESKCVDRQRERSNYLNYGEQQAESQNKKFQKVVTFNGGFRNVSKYSRKFTKSSNFKQFSNEQVDFNNLNIEGIKFTSPKQCRHFDSALIKSSFSHTSNHNLLLFKEHGVEKMQLMKNSLPNTIHASTIESKDERQNEGYKVQTTKQEIQLLVKSVTIDKIAFGKENYHAHGKQLVRLSAKIEDYGKKNQKKGDLSKTTAVRKKLKERPQSCHPLSFANFAYQK